MDATHGEKPDSLRVRIIGGALLVAALGGIGIPVANAVHNAQVEAASWKAMVAAAAAYQGAIELGGTLDALNTKAVQQKAAYDAEQARLAAENAAQEKAAADLAAAEAAAEEARQAAEQQAAQNAQQSVGADAETPATTSDGKLPSGSPVPWIVNPDPQDIAGGRWDTSACASGSASGNPAICD